MTDYEQEMEDEHGASLGDPRRCPRHPHIKTSSNDGMFDAPCGECEWEMDHDTDIVTDPISSLRGRAACGDLSAVGALDFAGEPEPDLDELPF